MGQKVFFTNGELAVVIKALAKAIDPQKGCEEVRADLKRPRYAGLETAFLKVWRVGEWFIPR